MIEPGPMWPGPERHATGKLKTLHPRSRDALDQASPFKKTAN
ncbi:hypothetical protein RR42_m0866 [Cupriavidus basilensis]|uniref:Uncharacterized protein n=1 Tax=Cupriavidus basilensis TaxID=68895 RepID=A0A0C4Y5V6_9BURK|nr:hypothetical protein RR42_m0866 [Cupriavidus basilensis]